MSTIPPNSGQQFGRKAQIIVAKTGTVPPTVPAVAGTPGQQTTFQTADQPGLDLSEFRFNFVISQADVQTPDTAQAKIYNLSDQTMALISKEYQRLIIQAGYENGNYGIIFDGTIKQVRRGRENPVDTYMAISASDGDLAYNFGLISTTLAAGAGPNDQVNAIMNNAFGPQGITAGYMAPLTGGILPRGKVLFGMAREHMRDIAATNGVTWSFQDGQLTVIPLTSYVPGEAVVLTSKTGMIGLPEQTNNGIAIRCLLNPRIKIGTRVQINNKSIQQAQADLQYTAINLFADVSADGFYRVLVAEHRGDTRGNEWYSDLICLTVDPTAPVVNSVKPFG